MFRLGLVISVLLSIASAVVAQDTVKPLASDASLTETQKWLAGTLTEYASFKARASSSSVSDVKFTGCDLKFTLVRKTGGISQDAVGVTNRVNTIKTDVVFDLARIDADRLEITDHLIPEFQILAIPYRTDTQAERIQELVVRQEAAEPLKAALAHARLLCSQRN